MQFRPWRRILFVIWLIAICCPAATFGAQPSKRAGDGFVSLFDGKTLTGWNVEPKTKTSDWTVRDGVIVGRGGKGQSYLAWKDKGLTDFELKLSYRLPRKGNTGIDIRGRPVLAGRRRFESYHADFGHVGIGPHILGAWDFHFTKRKEHPCNRGTRLVIGADGKAHSSKISGALAKADIRPRQWNDVRIIARGNHFQFFINDKIAAEFTDNAKSGRLDKGVIRLQIHDKGMHVEFKDIRMKLLTPAPQSQDRVTVGLQKQLLVDDYVIAEKHNVTRELGKVKKCGIVMKPTLPTDFIPPRGKRGHGYYERSLKSGKKPDGSRVALDFGFFTTVLWNEKDKKFQMWYMPWRMAGVGYAESKDGINWTKPLVGKDGKNNIVHLSQSFSCMIDPTVPWGHREKYKAAFDSNTDRVCQTGLAYSADGIHWSDYNNGKPVTHRAADFFCQILWDPIMKKYRLMCRTDIGGQGGKKEYRSARIMVHDKGNDLKKHPTAWKTIADRIVVDDPKKEKNPWGNPRLQFNWLTTWIYEGVYFAPMNVYTMDKSEMFEGFDYKTRHEKDVIDIYVGTSRDGMNFDKSWIYARKPLVPRGPAGSFDKDCVFPPSQFVTHKDEHWIFYGAASERHYSIGRDMKIGLAKLRLDGFICLQAKDKPGTVVTKPFKLEGDKLEVNVNAKAGWVQVELLDETGKEIPGFSSTSKGVDELRLTPKWKSGGDSSPLKGKTVKLKFTLQNARLYAFQITRGSAGEILYNGIELPDQWPPRRKELKRAPMPVPYLKNPPKVIPIDVGRQLLVDDFLIEKSDLKRTFHRPTFHETNPVVKADQPWETSGKSYFVAPFQGSVLHDPSDQLFKMWYLHSTKGDYYCNSYGYATSKDGIHWDKPVFTESGKPDANTVSPKKGTNLVIQGRRTCCNSVILDHNAKSPGERFKMFSSDHFNRTWNCVYRTSGNGIRWSAPLVERRVWGDYVLAFYNPFRRMWVYEARIHGGAVGRCRAYMEGPDLHKLAERIPYQRGMKIEGDSVYWVGADDLDPRHPDPRFKNIKPQLYSLSATPYESLMLGLFAIWTGPDNRTVAREGTQKYCRILTGFSRDGFHWARPDRKPFISPSWKKGTWNFGNAQPVGGCCLIVGDKLYIYFSARVEDKTGMHGNATTGLALLRRDGFASLDAVKQAGAMTTQPVSFKGKHLFVNADCPKGELRAEVLDRDGKVIPPLSLANSVPVRVDSTLCEMTWKGGKDLSSLAGKPIRFRFQLTNGSLYAFWVSPAKSGASHGYVGSGGPGFTGPTDTVGQGALKPAAEKLVPVGLQKQLFVDDYVVAKKENVTLEVGQAKKYGVVMKPTLVTDFQSGKIHEGPDGGFGFESHFCWFFSPHWDANKKMFRLWYMGGKRHGSGLAYAESKDGIHWTKPMVSRDGKSNLVLDFGLDGATATIDPNVPYGAPDKFKCAYFPIKGPCQTRLGYSADGIRWKFYNNAKPVTDRAADFSNQILWDPIRKRYLLLCRQDFAGGGGIGELRGVRIMEHSKANDLINHPTAWKTLTTFALKDPNKALIPGTKTPLYQIHTFPMWYYEGVWFGLTDILAATNKHLKKGTQDYHTRHDRGVWEFYMAPSRDGVKHDFSVAAYPRKALIPRGPAGSFDKDCVRPPANIITHKDEHWIYYLATNERWGCHKWDARLALAKLRLDGFFFLQAKEKPGTVVTKPFKLEGDKLQVNVEAKAGWVQVELLDETGKEIPGFSDKASKQHKGADDLRLTPQWKSGGDLSPLIGKTVKLKFTLQNAKLYAFDFNQSKSPNKALDDTAAEKLAPVGLKKQLFIDDVLIHRRQGVVRRVQPAAKMDKPVLAPERPWEFSYLGESGDPGVGKRIYVYGTAFYDPLGKQYRMWYMSRMSRGHKHTIPELKIPGGGNRHCDLTLYATSKDGISWRRPDLDLVRFNGSGKNNIMFDFHGASVILDREEPDPQKRYKAIGFIRRHHAIRMCHSSDGVHWSAPKPAGDRKNEGSFNVCYVPGLGCYVAGSIERSSDARYEFKNWQGQRGRKRVIATLRTDGKDLTKWEKKVFIYPDDKDDPNTQFYGMTPFVYGDLVLGFLHVLHYKGPGPANDDGPMDVQLVYTRDGRTWRRLEDRRPVISPGRKGSFDGGMIMGTANGAFVHGDRLIAYYTASNTTHGALVKDKFFTIGRATWPRDRLVALETGDKPGTIVTKPFKLEGDKLEVNVDAKAGWVQVELLDENGKAIPGFSGKAAKQHKGADELRLAPKWKSGGDLSPLKGKTVKLKFTLQNAKLYSFSFHE